MLVLANRNRLPQSLLLRHCRFCARLVNVPATFLVQFAGLQHTTASTAALIIGTLPPLVALAARIFLGERLGRRGWIAVGVSTAGIAVTVARPGGGIGWMGDALVFASLLAVVGWILLGKRLLVDYPPVAASAWILAFGTLVLTPISLLMEGLPRLGLSVSAWASIAVLGLGCSAASTVLWNAGLSRIPASRAGVFLNVEPLVGAGLGIVVLGDPPSPRLLIGGALVVGAAIAITRRRSGN